LRQVREDLEKNLRAALSSALARLELVTREEFDIQAALLARTRERLEQLQARIEELERRIRSDQSGPP
jgi:BMFP domain-containing protein YqiC